MAKKNTKMRLLAPTEEFCLSLGRGTRKKCLAKLPGLVSEELDYAATVRHHGVKERDEIVDTSVMEYFAAKQEGRRPARDIIPAMKHKKACPPPKDKKGKVKGGRACHAEIVFLAERDAKKAGTIVGPHLRFCPTVNKPGILVPVRSSRAAGEISKAYCDCIEGGNEAKFCAKAIAPRGKLGGLGSSDASDYAGEAAMAREEERRAVERMSVADMKSAAWGLRDDAQRLRKYASRMASTQSEIDYLLGRATYYEGRAEEYERRIARAGGLAGLRQRRQLRRRRNRR